MQAGIEFPRQRIIHRPVPRNAGKSCKLRGPDTHSVVRFAAGARARMAMVEIAFVHYL